MGNSDRKLISVEEAISFLPEGETVHTFRNPRGMLLGGDWDKDKIIATLKESGEIEVTGDIAQSMNHGIAIMHMGSMLFIETKSDFGD